MKRSNPRFFSLAFVLRRGQILLPSLFVIPSLLIFVYLLFETTKISREKIRQQFAVDSASFIQMGDYTNLLNRTAYVNGPFPHRIFRERYACPPGDKYGYDDDSGEICEYDILYDAGAFPKDIEDSSSGVDPQALDEKSIWRIEFTNNSNNPTNPWGNNTVRDPVKTNPTSNADIEMFDLTTSAQGGSIKLPWPVASGIYMFYAQVYSLLGSVEESQWTVFDRLTDTFNFFRKSYYLNAGTQECVNNPGACGEDGLRSNGGFISAKLRKAPGGDFMMHYIKHIEFHAKVYTGGWPSPYYLGKSNPAMDMTLGSDPHGLFQLATVSDSFLDKLGRGLQVYQGWTAPSNYFNVKFNDIAACKEVGRPCVHSRIATQCPQLTSASNNCVWPNPTPKYQTRLYP
ncbi:MAG: hypothetical protein WCK76_08155 [Elusimicrobiota bacterium]|nr:hypothetical protein [Elusimicrobiota bacterium]